MTEKPIATIASLQSEKDRRLIRLGRAALALQKLNRLPAFPTENEVNKLLQNLLDIIYYELGYPDCQLFLTDELGSELEFRCGTGFLLGNEAGRKAFRNWRPKLNEAGRQGHSGLVGWVGSNQRPANVPNVLVDERFYTLEERTNTRSELTVPLLSGSKLIGVLDIQSNQLNAFDELDVEIITYFASQAATIVQSAHLARVSANSLQDLTILALTGSGVNNALTLPEIGHLVLQSGVRVLNAASGNIFTLHNNPRRLTLLASLNVTTEVSDDSVQVSPLLAQVLESRQAAFITDLNDLDEPPSVIEKLREVPIAAFTCLPLYVREEALGVLFINYSEPHLFTSSEKHLLSIFADQAAAALLNARVSQREQLARSFAESLARSSRLISSHLELDEVLQTIITEASEALKTPMCSITLIDKDEKHMETVAGKGLQPESLLVKLELGKGFVGTVAATGQLWKEYDIALLPEFENNLVRLRENWHAGIALPIKVGGTQGRVIGVLCTYDHLPRNFKAVEIAYLEGLADMAAVAITNAQNFAALKRERDMYQALLENANDPIFLLHPGSGGILDANRRATECTGYSYEELLKLPVLQLYPPEEHLKLNLLYHHSLEANVRLTPIVDQIMMCRKDGTVFPASYSAQLVQVGEEQIIIQIVRDMSERRAFEQQLVRHEQLRVLGQLASGVAHDFNNLLTGILGVSELLLKGVPDKERHLLQMLRQSALDGAQMVRRVQLLGPGHPGSEFSAVELNDLLNDVIELTRSRWRDEAHQRGAIIEVEVETEALPLINGNASELREVLTNLVLNAVDAMPNGGRLTLSTSQREEEAWLLVEDNGTGMSDETQRHLFEPFYTTKPKDGHGLGLSVSNSIIARHNGTIEVKSRLGVGSRFIIKLPLTLTAQAKTETDDPLVTKPLRILAVDDQPNLLYILTRILETDHHTVVSTTSGHEAVRIFTDQPDDFDLVFTDLSIADLNGWEVARSIKAVRPNVPIVLVTGWGGDFDPAMIAAHGLAEVVQKPYRLSDVQAAILRVVGN